MSTESAGPRNVLITRAEMSLRSSRSAPVSSLMHASTLPPSYRIQSLLIRTLRRRSCTAPLPTTLQTVTRAAFARFAPWPRVEGAFRFTLLAYRSRSSRVERRFHSISFRGETVCGRSLFRRYLLRPRGAAGGRRRGGLDVHVLLGHLLGRVARRCAGRCLSLIVCVAHLNVRHRLLVYIVCPLLALRKLLV